MSANNSQKQPWHIAAVVTLLVLLALLLPAASSQSAPLATPGDLEIQNLQIFPANPRLGDAISGLMKKGSGSPW